MSDVTPLTPERALEVSDASYRVLMEQVTDGVVTADAEGRIADANAAACHMTGYALADLRALTVAALLAVDSRDGLTSRIAALPIGVVLRAEEQFRRKDGSVFRGALAAARPSDARLQVTVRDLSSRAEQDRAIHTLQALHRQDADTLRTLLATAAQGIMAVDREGIVRLANPALEAMLGWGPGELVGQPHAALIPAALRDRHAGLQAEYWAAPRPRPMGSGLNLLARRKDGSSVPVEISLAPVETRDGRTVFAFVSDISARRREEEQRATYARELERQAGLLRRLASELTLAEQQSREDLAKVLHDHLQQLLFSARLRLQRLSGRLVHGEPATAELAEQASRDLDEAIATTRSFVAELFPPMLHEAGLAAALMWLQGWARDKYGLTVTLTADPAANPAARDVRTLLFESVKELVFNAAKHARTPHLDITLARAADGNLRLVVADGGAGFDPAQLQAPGHRHGTGFGLLAIRERLAGFGGRLEIDAAPGAGARFTLTAPGAARDAGHPAGGHARGSTSSSADPQALRVPRQLRVLLADDHALVRDGLRQLLSDTAQLIVVGEAADGAEAITLAGELRPDVIVMDVAMPTVDGVEATRRIHASWPEITILGLSTQERPGGLHAIEEAGAAGYFTKGDDAQHLLERLLRMQADLPAEGEGGQPGT